MANRKVYLAVGRTDTRLYRFDPIDGDVRVIGNVPAYPSGYTAMGAQYRGDGHEPLLHAVGGNKLVTMDAEEGTLTDAVVEGLPSGRTWYDGDIAADGTSLLVVSDPNVPSYTIDVTAKTASAGKLPGSGRWDDYSFHPKNGWLYAVEGDNGDLLHIDQAKEPMKQILRQAVFPPAEASGSDGSRKAYAAAFFDQDGMFYVVDSAGNVCFLDLTDPDTIPDKAQRIDGKIPVDGLEVMNGAGRITPLPIDPGYDYIVVDKQFKTSWPAPWPVQGRVYSYTLTVTAASPSNPGDRRDVRKFRISFDLPSAEGAAVESSGVEVSEHGDGRVYVESIGDQLLPAGQSRPVDIQVTVPGSGLPTEFPLEGLKAARLA
ncbi:DUF6923 family protein [Streptomyces luteogriseus]|uniref:DUF6923 family protein n=1 Tax=Streptomyces luteogriseus TaxID=68233 RepID=UPI003798F386